jgi:hypothetical protein
MLVFCSEELLALHPTSKLENHPLSAAHNCYFIHSQLLSISSSRLHPQLHYVVIRDPITMYRHSYDALFIQFFNEHYTCIESH